MKNTTHTTSIITRDEMIELFESLHSRGATTVQVHTRTEADLLRTGNPFPKGSVFKVSSFGVLTGRDYAAAVNRGLEKEGELPTFQAGKTWHCHYLNLNTIVRNRRDDSPSPKLYAMLPLNKRNAPTVAFEDAEGNPIEREAIAPWIPAKKESAKQAAAGLTGAKQVEVRTVAFENIIGITVNGETRLVPREA